MPNIRMPDGTVVAFPDTMPADQIKALIAKKFPEVAGGALGKPAGPGALTPPPNPSASPLPGVLGQAMNTSRAFTGGAAQGMTLGWGDEMLAGLFTPIEAGIDAFQGKPLDLGRSYNEALQRGRTEDKNQAALNPTANVMGQITGGIMGLGKAGLAKDIIAGGIYGAGSSDGDLQDRAFGGAAGAVTGGVLGKAVPWLAKKGGQVVEKAVQNRVTREAIKDAPSFAELKAASSSMFKSVDNSGVTVDTPAFSKFVQDLVSTAKKDRINPKLDEKAFPAYEELIGALSDVQKNGGALTLSDLHTLRQIAQKAATSGEGRDAMFANRIVDGLDQFITSPGAMKLPTNRIGNAKNAPNELLQAISTWSRARKIGLIEGAIDKANNYSSGKETGLRKQFSSLLNNKATANIWSPAEKEALRGVVNGTLPIQALRTLGIFKGVGGAVLGSAVGGPWGAALGGAAGLLGRKVTEKSAVSAAERAGKIVGTPNIPQVTIKNPLLSLPGAPLGFPLIQQENAWLPQLRGKT